MSPILISLYKSGIWCCRPPLTCENDCHELVSQEAVVDETPEPVEVCEDVVERVWAGLQQEGNPGPELGFRKTQ